MTDQELHVEPEALDAFAKTSLGRADQFQEVAAQVRDGAVGRHDFGVMPASFALYEQYSTFLADCLSGLNESVEAMEDIAEGIRQTALSYTTTDADNAAMFGN